MIRALDWRGKSSRGSEASARSSEASARSSEASDHRSEARGLEAGKFEAAWVRRAQRGERQALNAIVRAHQDRIYGFLYRMTNDRDLSLDLTQDTFLKAFKGLEGFKAEAALGPWLLAIARNCFRDHARMQRHDPWEEEDSGADDPALLRIASDSGVMEALQQVPSPLREALVLRHVEDLSYEQIAEALAAPLGTVKTWIHRGRASLRQLLEKGGGV